MNQSPLRTGETRLQATEVKGHCQKRWGGAVGRKAVIWFVSEENSPREAMKNNSEESVFNSTRETGFEQLSF